MENASKALLIAGAILLVIALIAIGMMILGQGQQTVEKTASSMDALTVQAKNEIVTPYLNRVLTTNEYNLLKSGAKKLGIDITAAYDKNAIATATAYTDGVISAIEYKAPTTTTP